jgi:hypothetical protein
MSKAPTPLGYDVSKAVGISHPDCIVVVGFDREKNHIPRFLVRLHYRVSDAPVEWEAIARFDHNEDPNQGHNVYTEGLHIDVKAPSGWTKIHPPHGPLPQNRGVVIRACVDYFDAETQYFIDVYNGTIAPGGPARWPDGGIQPYTFVSPRSLIQCMSRESSHDVLSSDELSDLLAEATGTSAEEIERRAAAVEIGPPEDAELVDDE